MQIKEKGLIVDRRVKVFHIEYNLLLLLPNKFDLVFILFIEERNICHALFQIVEILLLLRSPLRNSDDT